MPDDQRPDVQLRTPINSLISYHYFQNEDVASLAGRGLRIIGDCGAFSALNAGISIDIDQFGTWARKWKDSLFWIASLDVIGNPVASWENYRHLRDTYGLDVVPTVHFGSDPREMDRYVADGVDFFGLGGMATREEMTHVKRWCIGMFKHARKEYPQVRFHGWGATRRQLAEPLPWFSLDSSSFGAAYRYGLMKLYDPERRRWVAMHMNGRDVHTNAHLLRDVYGIDPEAIQHSTTHSRRDIVRVCVKAWQFYEDFLKSRFTVSAPAYGLNSQPTTGPNAHAALGLNLTWQKEALTDQPTTGPNLHLTFADVKSEIDYAGRTSSDVPS